MKNNVEKYLKACIKTVPDTLQNRIIKPDLYQNYIIYCRDKKQQEVGKREFYKTMKSLGYGEVKSSGHEYYKGVKFQEQKMADSKNIWDQADLISLMKKDYDKAVAERDEAKRDADQYCQMVDKCEKEIEELKDKLLIAEKENNALKEEKIQLGKMQLKTVDFDKEIDSLQKRIAQYNAEINVVSAEVNEFRKDVSVLITGVSQLQEKKKKLEGVMSDLVGCSKRLMNMK